MNVLIHTIKNDMHAAAVAWALKEKGVNTDLLFAADFPSRAKSSIHVGALSDHARLQHEGNESSVKTGSYEVIWHRRLAGSVADAEAHPADVQFIEQESSAYLDGFSLLLERQNSTAFLVNSLAARERARSKSLQLSVAQECGFTIPETIISNDRDQIGAFLNRNGPLCVAKPLTGHAWDTTAGGRIATQTVAINASMLANTKVALSPLIVQAQISKLEELRVVVMGMSVFVAAVTTGTPRIDWRTGAFAIESPTFEISEQEKKACLDVMEQLGIVLAALISFVMRTELWFLLKSMKWASSCF